MTTDRQTADTMVAEFLARGGRIRKIPDAVPTTDAEVLRYLKDRDVIVEPAPAHNGSANGGKYLYDGNVINLRRLVQLANQHRRRQRLPPYELKLPR